MKNDGELKEMLKAAKVTAKKRGWEKYHTPKNMAMDLSREAGEVLEHFIWEENEEILADKERIEEIRREMGDVLHALILLADILGVDLAESFWTKLREIDVKYPAEKIYGTSGYKFKKGRG